MEENKRVAWPKLLYFLRGYWQEEITRWAVLVLLCRRKRSPVHHVLVILPINCLSLDLTRRKMASITDCTVPVSKANFTWLWCSRMRMRDRWKSTRMFFTFSWLRDQCLRCNWLKLHASLSCRRISCLHEVESLFSIAAASRPVLA